MEGGNGIFQNMVPILETRIYQVGRCQKLRGKSISTFRVWKNPSRNREGGRHRRGMVVFSKMVPILEMRIYQVGRCHG